MASRYQSKSNHSFNSLTLKPIQFFLIKGCVMFTRALSLLHGSKCKGIISLKILFHSAYFN